MLFIWRNISLLLWKPKFHHHNYLSSLYRKYPEIIQSHSCLHNFLTVLFAWLTSTHNSHMRASFTRRLQTIEALCYVIFLSPMMLPSFLFEYPTQHILLRHLVCSSIPAEDRSHAFKPTCKVYNFNVRLMKIFRLLEKIGRIKSEIY